MTSLNKQRQILKKNIKMEKDMVNKGKTYTNLRTGDVFQPSHYKKAMKQDKKDLRNVNKKIALKSLKSAAKNAYKSSPIGKVEKAYKVTKAGLMNFLKKKKK